MPVLATLSALRGARTVRRIKGTDASLHKRRDLRPAGALDALIAGAVAESLALDPERVDRGLFAQAMRQRPLTGLFDA